MYLFLVEALNSNRCTKYMTNYPTFYLKIPIEASDSFSESIILFDLNPGLSKYVIEPNK